MCSVQSLPVNNQYIYWNNSEFQHLLTTFLSLLIAIYYFFIRFTAHRGLGFNYFILYSITIGPAAPQTALWGGPGAEIRTRDGQIIPPETVASILKRVNISF